MEAIVVIILQIFFATCSNELEYLNISFKNSLPSKTLRAYVVFWCCSIDQQVYLSFCHKSKPFPNLDINFNNCKHDAPWNFWNWGISLGEYHRIFPSFSWGIFGHVRRLDQSRASENIWWIIKPYIPLQCEPVRKLKNVVWILMAHSDWVLITVTLRHNTMARQDWHDQLTD